MRKTDVKLMVVLIIQTLVGSRQTTLTYQYRLAQVNMLTHCRDFERET